MRIQGLPDISEVLDGMDIYGLIINNRLRLTCCQDEDDYR